LSFSNCSEKEHLGISGTGVYGQIWPSCHLIDNATAKNEAKSIEVNNGKSNHRLYPSFLEH